MKICIEDKGPGIAEKDRKRIFDKFYRCNNDMSKKSRGSGLGLAIVKGIINMHGGSIWVESEMGRGSRFNFTLPRKNIDEKENSGC